MRKLIGSAVLVTVLAIAPTLASAQRRPAARAAAPRSQQHPSFGVQLDWGNDPNFGIGGRGVFALQPLFPQAPLDGLVAFDYFFSGHNRKYWVVHGNVASRFRVPAA